MNNPSAQPSGLIYESDFLRIRDILTVLFKHQRVIIAIFLLFTILSLLVPMKMTPIYQAEASLMVKIGREHIYNSEVGDQSQKVAFDLQALIAPEIEILTTRDLRLRVLEVLGVGTIYPDILENEFLTNSPLETAQGRFQNNLTVTQSGKSNVINLTFEHHDPEVAARALNLLSELWKEKHLAIFSNPQASFLKEQVEVFRKKLEQSETTLQEFKQEHEISSISDQRKLLLDQRQNFDSRLKFNEDEIQGSGSKIHSLRRQLKDIPEYIPMWTEKEQKDQIVDATRQELLDLRRKEHHLLGKYEEHSRMVTDIREEIARIQAYINEQEAQIKDDQVTTIRNPVYQDLQLELLNTESELTSLKTKGGVIQRQIEEIARQIARLNRLEKQFDGLQREVDKDRENVKMYVGKLEMANVSRQMDDRQIANVSVIQAASIPIAPIKPRKLLIFALGMGLGMLSGMAWAFVSELLKTSYIRPEQAALEQGIPVLTSISYKS
ncbi:GumC family protein [Nitrospira sp. T9]|uniref:GumC family protein n=1 Tax=unclassified Nitrospira TaxID=2652172 RepID=UPI003F9796F0